MIVRLIEFMKISKKVEEDVYHNAPGLRREEDHACIIEGIKRDLRQGRHSSEVLELFRDFATVLFRGFLRTKVDFHFPSVSSFSLKCISGF